MFNIPGVFYTNDPKNIYDEQWLIDTNKVNNLKQHKFTVLDFSSEHYGDDTLSILYQQLIDCDLNFLLLSHDIKDHKRLPRLLFFPHWYHWAKEHFVTTGLLDNSKNFQWGCLNGNPRPHRIYNYVYSKQKSYFDSACFSMHNAEGATRLDDVTLDTQIIDLWDELKVGMRERSAGLNHNGLRPDADCRLPACADAYVQLVTETTVIPKIFVSEKTWKPIASGQLFLIFGNPGIIDYLRSQGVDVYDDLIDHSYDYENDWKTRLHLIHEQLEKLLKLDLKNIYVNTYYRRKLNSEKFFSGEFDKQYFREIQECINTQS